MSINSNFIYSMFNLHNLHVGYRKCTVIKYNIFFIWYTHDLHSSGWNVLGTQLFVMILSIVHTLPSRHRVIIHTVYILPCSTSINTSPELFAAAPTQTHRHPRAVARASSAYPFPQRSTPTPSPDPDWNQDLPVYGRRRVYVCVCVCVCVCGGGRRTR